MLYENFFYLYKNWNDDSHILKNTKNPKLELKEISNAQIEKTKNNMDENEAQYRFKEGCDVTIISNI